MGLLDSTSHALQLFIGLSSGIVLFVLGFGGYTRALFIAIVVMIPFQPIDSQYGSINMVLVYVVGCAMLLSNFRREVSTSVSTPLVVPFALLLFAFFISWALAPKMFWLKYMASLVQVGSSVVLFYMSYAFFEKEKDLEIFFKALIFSNVLVIGYCLVQLYIGFGHFTLFGIEELAISENRVDKRLTGPFNAVGITAEYLVIQSLVLAHYMVQTGKLHRLGYAVFFLNLTLLVATGNRGGFIIAILGSLMFLYFYYRFIGAKGFLLVVLVLFFGFAGGSFVLMKYTEFNVLYDRVLGTKFSGYVPDTRKGWFEVVDNIMEMPLFGHGPRIVKPIDYPTIPQKWPKGYITYYPHSLYLYILYTTGLFGFLAYGVWAITYWQLLQSEKGYQRRKGVSDGLSMLGMIIFVIFLIDQIKVEFLRFHLLDYQHFLAALFGMFAALRKLRVECEAKNWGT